ncbi:hypothetical protein [uncultured Alistipes sp.]|uniref:hypothetical protein n=1 Tax=uncultured Alistipes sp. TaxID=538949 RepID=UPI0025953B5E|nr:hypothetical protein [uncultured Alistipes sp.]
MKGPGPEIACAPCAFILGKQPRRCWTQRTGKPLARLLLFSGFTLPVSKFRLPALRLPARQDDDDQHQPPAPTLVKAPVVTWR